MENAYKPAGFFPPVTRNLIIINFLVWFAELVLPRYGIDLISIFGLHYFEASEFNPMQLFTYMFLHSDDSINHVFFNMFSLWMFGSLIERFWGKWRYLFFYITCGLSAAIVQEVVWFFSFHELALIGSDLVRIGSGAVVQANEALNMAITVGASGAVFGLLLAFGMLFPNSKIFLLFIPIPIKAKYFVIIYGVAELFFGVSAVGDNVAHFAHLGGMLGGLILILLWRKKGEIDGPYN
ncbi:membrane protein [Porphyromonas macacae]|uniref:Rhomboid protease AarA n=1 Tax=Porphyromonas macacae TaxID=28115 RepID=A0A379DFY7_9PORP|nr:rhomboid family intramembrane serine protease [Porphyromonas macacae]KGN99513.1 membrane protein [Porphyromonas macacae]SUB76894.1 Rhomboid protease AarA [Porphyromonas macacae]